MGPVKNYLAEEDKTISEINLNPSFLTQLISLIDDGIISFGIASQKIFPHLINNPQVDLGEYIRTEGLQIQSADETEKHIEAALTKHAKKITDYKKGNICWFV